MTWYVHNRSASLFSASFAIAGDTSLLSTIQFHSISMVRMQRVGTLYAALLARSNTKITVGSCSSSGGIASTCWKMKARSLSWNAYAISRKSL